MDGRKAVSLKTSLATKQVIMTYEDGDLVRVPRKELDHVGIVYFGTNAQGIVVAIVKIA